MSFKFSLTPLLPAVLVAPVLFGCGGAAGDRAAPAPVAKDAFAARTHAYRKLPPPATTSTVIPTTAAMWNTVYDGYGAVTYDAAAGVTLAPMAATQPAATHAALTLANLPAMRNFRLRLTATTVEQLRRNSAPNPWEVFWIFFNYNPSASGKDTNYFLLKPNGAELGTASGEVGQTFLQTNPASAAAVGVANTFEVEKSGNRVRVWINGVPAADYAGAIIDVPGSIGLYAEDARVQITDVQVTALP